jgi:hypothetical protein
MAVCQSQQLSLNHRYREQAPSHTDRARLQTSINPRKPLDHWLLTMLGLPQVVGALHRQP